LDPHKKFDIWQETQINHDKTCANLRLENLHSGKCGEIKIFRMKFFKSVSHVYGFVNVFPNFRHENRKDGLGFSALSPMKIGPIYHGQVGIPPALNLENFHQFSKKFEDESLEEFRLSQINGFLDEIPHRYKKFGENNKNIPEFFVWLDKSGKEHHLSYISSRQFYCNFFITELCKT